MAIIMSISVKKINRCSGSLFLHIAYHFELNKKKKALISHLNDDEHKGNVNSLCSIVVQNLMVLQPPL